MTKNLNSYTYGIDNGNNLFQLDKEDLEYFYNKYSNLLKIEMGKNIEEIKENYKNII